MVRESVLGANGGAQSRRRTPPHRPLQVSGTGRRAGGSRGPGSGGGPESGRGARRRADRGAPPGRAAGPPLPHAPRLRGAETDVTLPVEAAVLLTRPGPGRAGCVHALVRDTVHTDLSDVRRSRLHDHIARTLHRQRLRGFGRARRGGRPDRAGAGRARSGPGTPPTMPRRTGLSPRPDTVPKNDEGKEKDLLASPKL